MTGTQALQTLEPPSPARSAPTVQASQPTKVDAIQPSRFMRAVASETQALRWEYRAIASLAGIGAKVEETALRARRDLDDMDRYIKRTEKLLELQKDCPSRDVAGQDSEAFPEVIEELLECDTVLGERRSGELENLEALEVIEEIEDESCRTTASAHRSSSSCHVPSPCRPAKPIEFHSPATYPREQAAKQSQSIRRMPVARSVRRLGANLQRIPAK